MADIRRLTDEAGFISLIEREQGDPSTACGILPNQSDDFGEALEEQEPRWRELSFEAWVGNTLVGAATASWVDGQTRGWVLGPWISASYWHEVGQPLVTACLDLMPAALTRVDMCGDMANIKLRELAEGMGWEGAIITFTMECLHQEFHFGSDESVLAGLITRHATEEDLPDIAVLHDQEFPKTYATADQLLHDEDSVLFVAELDGKFAGYVSGERYSTNEGALDFIAVIPELRQKGIAMALCRGIVTYLDEERYLLTWDDRFPIARKLVERLGFRTITSARTYILRRSPKK